MPPALITPSKIGIVLAIIVFLALLIYLFVQKKKKERYLASKPVPAIGDTIMEQIEIQGKTQEQLKAYTGLSSLDLARLMDGEIGVDEELAKRLEDYLEISADFWLELDKSYLRDLKEWEQEGKKFEHKRL